MCGGRQQAEADRNEGQQRGGLTEERVPHPFRGDRVGPVVDVRVMDRLGNDLALQDVPASGLHVGTLFERREESRIEFRKRPFNVPRDVGFGQRERLRPHPQQRRRQPRSADDRREYQGIGPTETEPRQGQHREADPAPRQLPPQPESPETLPDSRQLLTKLLFQHDDSPGPRPVHSPVAGYRWAEQASLPSRRELRLEFRPTSFESG